MKKALVVCAVAAALAGGVFALDFATMKVPQAVINGAVWNWWGDVAEKTGEKERMGTIKIMYLIGLYEGLEIGLSEAKKSVGDFYPVGVSYEGLVPSLDKFFSDERNLDLPVPLALMAIHNDLKGFDRGKEDKDLDAIRREIRRLLEEKGGAEKGGAEKGVKPTPRSMPPTPKPDEKNLIRDMR